MADGNAYSYAVREIVQYATDGENDMIVGPEARGSLLAVPLPLSWDWLHLFKPGKIATKSFQLTMKKSNGIDTLDQNEMPSNLCNLIVGMTS